MVVTGMGITSCLGNTLEDVKDSWYNCKSGIKKSEKYTELGLKSRVCGKPDLSEEDVKKAINRKSLRFMGVNAQYAYIAMQSAIENSGLTEEQYQNPRTSAILGQGGTSIDDVTDAIDNVKKGLPENGGEFNEGGLNKMSGVGPYRVTKTMGRWARWPWHRNRGRGGGSRCCAAASPFMGEGPPSSQGLELQA